MLYDYTWSVHTVHAGHAIISNHNWTAIKESVGTFAFPLYIGINIALTVVTRIVQLFLYMVMYFSAGTQGVETYSSGLQNAYN